MRLGKCERCEALSAQLDYMHQLVDQLLSTIGSRPVMSQADHIPEQKPEVSDPPTHQVGIIPINEEEFV